MATHPHTAQGSSYLPLHTTSTYSARQLTPVASVESTAAAEPNSSQVSPGPGGGDGMPFLPLQARQPRPTTTPSYRPAVLRPTERPCRPSPLTPPQSSSNSVDFELGADSPVPLSRQSTGDSFRRSAASVDSSAHEWVRPYGFGKVTAPPTREHWKVSEHCDRLTSARRPCTVGSSWLSFVACGGLVGRSVHQPASCHARATPGSDWNSDRRRSMTCVRWLACDEGIVFC